jgi:hypothetical protein
MVLLFTVQVAVLHVAVILIDKTIQLVTPSFLNLVVHVFGKLETYCDYLNWKWLAWLLNILAKISTTEEDRRQQKELIKEKEIVMYENELHQERYEYLIETLGSLEKQAENQTLTAEQIQTTCDLDVELSLLPYAAADTTHKFQQLEIHRRDGAWIRADRRTSSPILRTAGRYKRLGGCCTFDCGCCHKVRSVSFIGGSLSHCTSECGCCILQEGKCIGSNIEERRALSDPVYHCI